ncbi:3'(2'),5'-bisphosphate nucleotidase CysQ [Psychrosphaera sp. 1_MG-2023]|uniref:3'(2'),5'-bisphosphate nucleotidase CysQ n=1 Tax=unclassified Psychrosphaera TaxID=2641570 RepID=UPI0021112ABD|nr:MULTISPECIES: 3'(2'),5'-bisphosphate nucleotidase CysQ [unclassified Psychrosphaera]MDO6720439.1 3'(2'),5'-bisphosphate nucleotidase CysQ [Psychrosphaera sp. 1_MG-2023]
MEFTLPQLAHLSIDIATSAGEAIMDFFVKGDFEEFSKDDESPVTSADYAANEIVMAALTTLTPDIPIMSEETEHLALKDRKDWQLYWLVDPLDGTQEFVAGRSDFAVNIALIKNGQPVLGVVHVPVTKTTYWACKGHGTFKIQNGESQKIKAKPINREEPYLRVAISRVQTLDTITKYIKPDIPIEFVSLGSCALKSCLVAEGTADIYIRVGPTGEWDTGAPQIIVEEAGGCIIDSEFGELTYNLRESFLNPDFMVTSDSKFDWTSVIVPHVSRRD